MIASERDPQARRRFRRLTGKLDLRRFVFVDEMGSNLALTRLYGRAAPGTRVVDQVPSAWGRNLSTIGALGLTGMRTGLSVPGAIDGETMVFFAEEMLAPCLKRGEVVWFDNCPIHKVEEVAEAIEARGAWALFLPTASPDFNPIEHCWSKVKASLRAHQPRTLEALMDALVAAFASITVQDIAGWFRHCGYQVART